MAVNTTSEQDKDFGRNLWASIQDGLADIFEYEDASWVVDWVASNLEPQDVFEVSELEQWAENNGFVLEE